MRGPRGDTRERPRKESQERPKPKRDRRPRQRVSTTLSRRESQGKSERPKRRKIEAKSWQQCLFKAFLIFILGFSLCRWPRTKITEASQTTMLPALCFDLLSLWPLGFLLSFSSCHGGANSLPGSPVSLGFGPLLGLFS